MLAALQTCVARWSPNAFCTHGDNCSCALSSCCEMLATFCQSFVLGDGDDHDCCCTCHLPTEAWNVTVHDEFSRGFAHLLSIGLHSRGGHSRARYSNNCGEMKQMKRNKNENESEGTCARGPRRLLSLLSAFVFVSFHSFRFATAV